MSTSVARFKLTHQVKLEFLHHLRHLLRECTYLPDPAARDYFRSFILSRYRAYNPKKNDSTEFAFPPKRLWILDEQRQSRLLRACRKTRSALYRASHGDKKCLEKVLLYTYGRAGKRRHDLLQPYLPPDIPSDGDAVRGLMENLEKPANQQVPRISSALRAIAASQKKQPQEHISRLPVRDIDPRIPKINSWGRPMPVKRVRNIKRRSYSKLLDKILPPLPRQEWERLRDLSTGRIPFGGTVKRRGKVSEMPENSPFQPHTIHSRFMRRLWSKVFVQCSTMSSDGSGAWRVQWGNLSKELPPRIETDHNKDSFLFKGL